MRLILDIWRFTRICCLLCCCHIISYPWINVIGLHWPIFFIAASLALRQPYVCPGSAHWSPISMVPHLIGPLLIGPPTHWSPNTLLELIGPQSHWSPISLVPHFIGPPFQSSPHHRPIPMVPHLIGPPSHRFPISLVPQLAHRNHPFHWSPISLVPPTYWSPISLVPQFISPNYIIWTHWSPFSLVPLFINPPNFGQSQWSPISLVRYLIGPPIGTHAPPIPLVPLSYPPSLRLIGPPI